MKINILPIFEILDNTKPGSGGEIQLTDALNEFSLNEAMYAYNRGNIWVSVIYLK